PELIRKGSKGGKVAVLVPGKPDESLIVTLLTSKDKKRAMPLDAEPLPAADVAVIRRWVEAGAPEGTKPAEVVDTAGLNPAARQANGRVQPGRVYHFRRLRPFRSTGLDPPADHRDVRRRQRLRIQRHRPLLVLRRQQRDDQRLVGLAGHEHRDLAALAPFADQLG